MWIDKIKDYLTCDIFTGSMLKMCFNVVEVRQYLLGGRMQVVQFYWGGKSLKIREGNPQAILDA